MSSPISRRSGVASFRPEPYSGTDPPQGRALVALAIFPVLVLLTLILLGPVQMLSPVMALVTVASVGAVILLVGVLGFSPFPGLNVGGHGGQGWRDEPRGLKSGVALGLLVFASVPTIARVVLSGPHFSVDDLKHHAPYVTWWMQHGGFTFEHSCYPFNAELFALWFAPFP